MRRWLFLPALVLFGCPKAPEVPECVKELRPTPLRLLTRFEMDNTLKDVALDGTRPAQALPLEPLALGLDNNGDVVKTTADWQARMLDVAEAVAARAVHEHKAELVPCATQDAACGQAFITSFGRRAFRRPLTATEQTQFFELFEQGRASEGGFDAGLEWTLSAMLLSPQFLYRLEPFSAQDGIERVDPYALASRVSYFVWGSAPDEALLADAQSGALADDRTLDAQLDRMLKDPRAAAPANHFFSLWLDLDGVERVEKDPSLYPAFTLALRPSWRRSTELYLDDVFGTTRSLTRLLTSSVLFVDDAMGGMYGNGSVAPGAFVRLEMPADRRAGVLTQPSFLARLASPDQSSPVRRGVFVLDKLMCESVPPPPPAVMAVPPPVDPSSTTRERFDVHANTAGCSGCHLRMDGIGFGFEHYDAMGAYRLTDNSKPVDATGEVVQANEHALDGPFDGAPELMARLAKSRQVHDCLTSQWYRFALARVETKGDACSVAGAQQRFFDSGGDFDALRKAVAQSPAFRHHAREVP